MDQPSLIILTPLRIEELAIYRALGPLPLGVQVQLIGMRGVRLQMPSPGSSVILAGVAGALDPKLRVGDLVLDTPLPDLPQDLPWHVGPIHTEIDLVSNADDKARLFRRTHALAVDMEQEAVQRHLGPEVTAIGLRAISDAADMRVDPAVMDMVNVYGNPRPLRVLATLARRPWLIPHLRSLNANSKLALQNLGLGVKALVDRFTQAGGLR